MVREEGDMTLFAHEGTGAQLREGECRGQALADLAPKCLLLRRSQPIPALQ